MQMTRKRFMILAALIAWCDRDGVHWVKARHWRKATWTGVSGQLAGAVIGMTRGEQIAELERVYSRIPKIACRRKYQECCGPINMSLLEYRRIFGKDLQGMARGTQRT